VKHTKLFWLTCLFFLLAGCSMIENIAPAPPDTPVPTESIAEADPTVTPTLGEPEFINAVFCWESHIDEGEYNLVRFFPSGNLIDVFVQPYASCEEAWEKSSQYLTEESQMQFNHGTYHLSGDQIKYTLSPPNSNEVAGEITGSYGIDKLLLNRVGSDPREYILITIGE